jgi:hypothetical protein
MRRACVQNKRVCVRACVQFLHVVVQGCKHGQCAAVLCAWAISASGQAWTVCSDVVCLGDFCVRTSMGSVQWLCVRVRFLHPDEQDMQWPPVGMQWLCVRVHFPITQRKPDSGYARGQKDPIQLRDAYSCIATRGARVAEGASPGLSARPVGHRLCSCTAPQEIHCRLVDVRPIITQVRPPRAPVGAFDGRELVRFDDVKHLPTCHVEERREAESAHGTKHHGWPRLRCTPRSHAVPLTAWVLAFARSFSNSQELNTTTS